MMVPAGASYGATMAATAAIILWVEYY